MSKFNILILGHNGLLGNQVLAYFSERHNVYVIEGRWPDKNFKKSISDFNGDFIINCIGAIPQKNSGDGYFWEINFELPLWISSNCMKNTCVIHPTTDCEFDGKLEIQQQYGKYHHGNAVDEYGRSKYAFTKFVLENDVPVKILRTSIIGLEKQSNFSLLSWFLTSKESVKGYLDHLWNGITTLEWAKQAENIMNNWDITEKLTQIGTDPISKYELLKLISNVFSHRINIEPYNTGNFQNKTLKSDKQLKPLQDQLRELKACNHYK